MGSITVIGTGFSQGQISLDAVSVLERASGVILHTSRCGVAELLDARNIAYRSLDALYDEYEDFDEHARAAADAVKQAAREGDIAYCVFDIRDRSARLLISEGARAMPGPAIEGALLALADEGAAFVSASDWEDFTPDAATDTLIRELDSRELASDVKLRLMEAYPDDAEVRILSENGEIASGKLLELDRQERYSHMTSVLIKAEPDPARRASCTLRDIASQVRKSGFYRAVEFDALREAAERLAGGSAYAEDRGEFSLDEILCAAYEAVSEY